MSVKTIRRRIRRYVSMELREEKAVELYAARCHLPVSVVLLSMCKEGIAAVVAGGDPLGKLSGETVETVAEVSTGASLAD